MTTGDSALNQLTRHSRFVIGSQDRPISPKVYVEGLAKFVATTARELVAMLQPEADGVCSYPWPGETIRLKFEDTARIQLQPMAADATEASLALFGIANVIDGSIERGIRSFSNAATKQFGVHVTMLGSRVEAVFDWGQDPYAEERGTPPEVLTIADLQSARAGQHSDPQMIVGQALQACLQRLTQTLFTEAINWTLERWDVQPLPYRSDAGHSPDLLDTISPPLDNNQSLYPQRAYPRRVVIEGSDRYSAPVSDNWLAPTLARNRRRTDSANASEEPSGPLKRTFVELTTGTDGKRARPHTTKPLYRLWRREAELYEHDAQHDEGPDLRKIADKVGKSYGTVRNHFSEMNQYELYP